MSRFFDNLIRWLVVLAMPLFLVLTTARLLVADWYPRLEYAKPDFPRDRYGFTQQQRLDLALVAIHYLNRPEPAAQAISMLAAQKLPGSDRPLYTAAELSHMLDVKRLMDELWRVEAVAGVVAVGGLVVLLARRRSRVIGFNALVGGGVFTTLLLLGLGACVFLAWNTFFIQFHELFFSAGSWTFDYSDSLIRLFPDMFWSDAGTIIVVASLLEGLLASLVGYALSFWWTHRSGEAPVGAALTGIR